MNTGLRRSEVLGIDARRIDWAARKVTIIDRKNGKDLTIPLNPVAYDTLKALCANRIAGRVFTIKPRTLSGCFARALPTRRNRGLPDSRPAAYIRVTGVDSEAGRSVHGAAAARSHLDQVHGAVRSPERRTPEVGR
jgi:integrase